VKEYFLNLILRTLKYVQKLRLQTFLPASVRATFVATTVVMMSKLIFLAKYAKTDFSAGHTVLRQC